MRSNCNGWKKYICALLLLAVTVALSLSMPAGATSDTKEQMDAAQREKEAREAELAEAQQDLAQTQANLQGLEGVRNSYQGQMQILNENLQLVADQLAVLENKIALKQLEIDETTAALEQARLTRETQYESMKQRIRFLYENGGNNYVEILLSAGSFGELINYVDYIEELSAYDRLMLEEYIRVEGEVEAQEAALTEELAELDALRADVTAQQQEVSGLINQTANNIARTADTIEAVQAQEAAYEQEVEARQNEAAEAAAEYERIKAQYEEELRLSQLASQSGWRDVSQVQFEEGDRYLLANLIYCEAGGEPYEGQVAVGAVVINRVLSAVFPDTVTGVIYQRKQFSPVLDGHLALALANDRATASCYRAADEAMSGVTNVGNRVFFRTPIPGLTGLQIGGHIFY